MIEIILASVRDVPQLHKIYMDAAKRKQNYDDRSWEDGFSSEGVEWMVGLGTTFVARQNGRIVGVTALEWDDDRWEELDHNNAGYIRRLAIANDFHGKGLGKIVLDWACAQVLAKNRKYLRLDCASKNKSLCAYYESLGFVLIRQTKFPESDGTSNLYQKEA